MKIQEITRLIWERLLEKYEAQVIKKNDSVKMQALGYFLDVCKIMDKDNFLKKYSTTIGHDIYVPFEIGVGTDEECWKQIVTCAHECVHIEQCDRLGFFMFSADYLFSSLSRAKYEAEAYRVNLELHHWRYKEITDTQKLADKLKAYACTESDISFAKKYLDMSCTYIKQNGIAANPAQEVVSILKKEGFVF